MSLSKDSKSIKDDLGSRPEPEELPPPAYSETDPALKTQSSSHQRHDSRLSSSKEKELGAFDQSSAGSSSRVPQSSSGKHPEGLTREFSQMSLEQSRSATTGYPPPANAAHPPGPPPPQGHPGPMMPPQAPMMAPPRPPMGRLDSDDSDDGGWELQPGGVHPCIKLPLCFKVYCEKNRVTKTVFYIGRQKGDKLHFVSHGYQKFMDATIALHEGPSTSSRVLGNSVTHGKKVDVHLPFGDVVMHKESYWRADYYFDFPLRQGQGLERFEWDRATTKEVKQLGGSGHGWTLYYKKTGEPVAAYEVHTSHWSLSGRFAFLGRGATPEFGPDWCIMAVLSAFAMGQRKRDNDNGTVAAITIS